MYKEFLRQLYPQGIPQGMHLLLWSNKPNANDPKLSEKRSWWCGTLAEAGALLDRHVPRADANWYVGCCLSPRAMGAYARAKAAEVCCLPGLWLDMDVADGLHKKSAKLPSTVEEARALLWEMPAPPSIVVHSGGGLQGWWLLERPVRLVIPGEALSEEEADDGDWLMHHEGGGLEEWWNKHLLGLCQRRGWTTDSVFDLARVMRLPGTWNVKGPTPRPTTILYPAEGGEVVRYTPVELLGLMEQSTRGGVHGGLCGGSESGGGGAGGGVASSCGAAGHVPVEAGRSGAGGAPALDGRGGSSGEGVADGLRPAGGGAGGACAPAGVGEGLHHPSGGNPSRGGGVSGGGTSYEGPDASPDASSHGAARTHAGGSTSDPGACGGPHASNLEGGAVEPAIPVSVRAVAAVENLCEVPRFEQTWDRRRLDFHDQSLSSYDGALALFGANYGLEDEVIAEVIRMFRRRHGDADERAKGERADYVARTIRTAREKIQARGEGALGDGGLCGERAEEVRERVSQECARQREAESLREQHKRELSELRRREAAAKAGAREEERSRLRAEREARAEAQRAERAEIRERHRYEREMAKEVERAKKRELGRGPGRPAAPRRSVAVDAALEALQAVMAREDATQEERDRAHAELLARVVEKMEVPLEHVICYKAEPSTYALVVAGVHVPFASVTQLNTYKEVMLRIADATALVPPDKMEGWQSVFRAIIALREVKEVGDEGTDHGSMDEAIMTYLQAQPLLAGTDIARAIDLRAPFVRGGKLHVTIAAIRECVRDLQMQSPKAVASLLVKWGATPVILCYARTQGEAIVRTTTRAYLLPQQERWGRFIAKSNDEPTVEGKMLAAENGEVAEG